MGLSRRQLLAGTPLAALGVAVGSLNLGSAVSSVAAETNEKKSSVEGPTDPSRRLVRHSSGTGDGGGSAAEAEELDDFMFDLENDGKGWTGPGGSAKEAAVAEFPLSQSIAGVSMRLNQEILLASWLAANPAQLVADHFGLSLDQVKKFPKDSSGIVAARI